MHGYRFGYGFRRGKPRPRARFDFHVDPSHPDADDGGAGTADVPFASLAPLGALLADGTAVGIRAGADLSGQSIDAPSRQNVRIGIFGGDERAVLDCGKPVTGWTLADAPTNTWTVSFALSTPAYNPSLCYVTMTEDGVLMKRVATVGAVGALNPGGFHSTGEDGTVTLTLRPPAGGNPNSNGKVYGISDLDIAIRLGNGADVSGLETGNQRTNDGSIIVGAKSKVANCRIFNGHKHNLLFGYGSRISGNLIEEGHRHNEPGIMAVCYSPGAVEGTPDTVFENNILRCRGLLADPVEALYGHNSGGTSGANFYHRGNSYIDCWGGIQGGITGLAGQVFDADTTITFSALDPHPWVLPSPFMAGWRNMERLKVILTEPFARAFTVRDKFMEIGGGRTLEDAEIMTGPYWNWFFGDTTTSGARSVTVKRTKGVIMGGGALIRTSSSGLLTAVLEDNAIGCVRPIDQVSASGTVAITAINNDWPGVSSFRLANVNKTFAEWQALGHDTAGGAGGDLRAVTVPRGGALAGDLRDWPQTWIWVNAQDGDSIDDTAGEVIAVRSLSRGERAFALFEPTPGTDKVLLETAGGKPWLRAVANGGLTYALPDANMTVGLVAAVVRLDAALSAAVNHGTIVNGHASDEYQLRLGNVSGTFANEIVTFRNGGGSGYSYGHASQTWPALTPLLILAYYDPVQQKAFLRINGVAVGEMTAVSTVPKYLTAFQNNAPLRLLRGQSVANRLAGQLGELLIAGPASLDIIAEIETQMMARWGIS